jgi:uncharacterized transporter BF3802
MEQYLAQFHSGSVAYTILLYATVIAIGITLGKVKVFGISIGVTFVLFAGIVAGHFGFVVDTAISHFIKEFGLILFVFSIGLQVGPSFFSSFKKDGMMMNLLAASLILLNVVVVVVLFYIFAPNVTMPSLTGIMSGAVTNTPGLGAAQEALRQLFDAGKIDEIPQVALGYAVAYPFGVLGVILTMILIRFIFRINLEKENEKLTAQSDSAEKPEPFSVVFTSEVLNNKTIEDIRNLIGRQFIISRLKRNSQYFTPHADTVLQQDDVVKIVASLADEEAIISFMGRKTDIDWQESESVLVSRRIIVTQDNINGKTLAKLRLHSIYNVNITRVNRSGIDLMATPNLALHVGDRVMVVGELTDICRVERLLGNTLKKLNEPPIATIFIGIVLGILFGSIPFAFPGIPMPVKFGLAGGPLIIAILIGRFGPKFNMVTYTTQSANLMLREVGISLFLASVGIEAGRSFVDTVFSSNGLLWLAFGVLITFIPMMSISIFARKKMKMNYFSIVGLLAGSSTNPPALAYANSIAPNDEPAVAYSTVYPLTMFLRILIAQLMILIFI